MRGQDSPQDHSLLVQACQAGHRPADSWSSALSMVLCSFNCRPALWQEMSTQKAVNQPSLTNSEARV